MVQSIICKRVMSLQSRHASTVLGYGRHPALLTLNFGAFTAVLLLNSHRNLPVVLTADHQGSPTGMHGDGKGLQVGLMAVNDYNLTGCTHGMLSFKLVCYLQVVLQRT